MEKGKIRRVGKVIRAGRRYWSVCMRLVGEMMGERLSDREAELLGLWMSKGCGPLTRELRVEMMGELGMTESGISNYLSSLRGKGYVVKRDFELMEVVKGLRIWEGPMEFHITVEG